MPVTLSIPGKVALITGGSRGIGAASVRMFVEAGAKVVFNYQRARSDAERLVRELGDQNCHAVQAELSSISAGRDLVEAAVQRFGRLDILVANHGVWPPEDTPINEMSDDDWISTIGINLDSVFGLVKYAVAQMKRQRNDHGQATKPPVSSSTANPLEMRSASSNGGNVDPGPVRQSAGHIVLVSSTAGQRGEAYHCHYAATKGAVISMTKGLSTELAPHAIYVNCVAPGWVATDMAAPALSDPATREKVFRTIPMGRVALPEEIAAPILFLCTAHAGFVTGEIFNVNGGAVLVG